MHHRIRYAAAIVAAAAALSAGAAEEPGRERTLSVREIMEGVITPATNALWAADDPAGDAAWRTLENAAIATIAAATLIAGGGAGEHDAEWAAEAEWQAFNAAMKAAAEDALAAIRRQDIDALYAANDAIYFPCESCHLAFHPEVSAE